MIGRRSLLLAGVALPAVARAQCVTDTPSVDACQGGVRLTSPPGISLDLSFMTPGTLPPNVTFTRASTGTYFDAAGVMQTATTNTPRWDYDPVTHALRGMLIEEARTNSVLNSADASNASWVKTGITVVAPTVTGNQAVAPDGTTTGARMVMPAVSAAGNASYVTAAIATFTVTAYSFSVWLRGNVGGEQVWLCTTPDGVSYFRQAATLTTSWQRFTLVTGNLSAASWYLIIGTDRRDASQTATLAQTLFVWGGQMELGAFPTSYIPTTAAAATRAADMASMTGANFSSWFNASAGSFACETLYTTLGTGAGTNRTFEVSDGTTANFFSIIPDFFNTRHQLASTIASVAGTSVLIAGTPVAGVIVKASTAYNPNRTFCTNVGAGPSAVGSTAGGIAPTVNQITLGNRPDGTRSLNGYLRRARYWPRALSNAELQQVTT